MKIVTLEIENFRAIDHIKITDLSNTVVIAGPNGCGKSCVFDAIRLLKSLYGGYQQNEWQQWFNEYNINIQNKPNDILKLFKNKTKKIRIFAEFIFTDREKEYLKNNASQLIYQADIAKVMPRRFYPFLGKIGGKQLMDEKKEQLNIEANAAVTKLLNELKYDTITGEIYLNIDGVPDIAESKTLEIVFNTYIPSDIGVIDYHGPNRSFSREDIGSVNIGLESFEQQSRQNALYNYNNKYSNIKGEMASAYIRDIIAREAGSTNSASVSLIDTLQELFNTFFPGKKFHGPKAISDGSLSFPVELDSGEIHDINELSSGEKEILYGYLRLHNTAPKDSMILLDEPELHLNPRLIHGLGKFYQKHLGDSYGNQIWLVTHSDTLLREAVGEQGFTVYHMLSSNRKEPVENQLQLITVSKDIDKVILDLVGDLATYKPNDKIVLFESGGDAEFDMKMIRELFPLFYNSINPISAGNKKAVRELHRLLEHASKAADMGLNIYSIVDLDSEVDSYNDGVKRLTWDVYHIENYLLDSRYIVLALNSISLDNKLTEYDVDSELINCAKDTLCKIVTHSLTKEINNTIINCINLNIDPNTKNVSHDIYSAINRSVTRLNEIKDLHLSLGKLNEHEASILNKLTLSLTDTTWKQHFRGRDILKQFVKKHSKGYNYEAFRNLIISQMRREGYQPEGMLNVINKIIN